MRLGFKRFNIGKRKFCISAYIWLELTTAYRFVKDKGYEETGKYAISWMHFNLLPVIRYEYIVSTQSLCLEWFFWKIEIKDETYLSMGGV